MSILQQLEQQGVLAPLDVRFAVALGRLAGITDERVLLGAALACRAPGRGDVGVDLHAVPEMLAQLGAEPLPDMPDTKAWVDALASATDVVRGPSEAKDAPLVLNGSDLYLERYWVYQERLASLIGRRFAEEHRTVDTHRLRQLIQRLGFDDPCAILQKQAAVTAVHRGFAIIAGGPGTGKTTVVAKLLTLLQVLERERMGRSLRVRLAAPTGKAAARMSESLRLRAQDIPADLGVDLVVEASTIHRLLGWTPGTGFKHHADHPLPLDLLVVDEASMIDLPLMTKLVDAVPKDARLVLLGDPDQLASVELGAVFRDLCMASAGAKSVSMAERLEDSGIERIGPEPTESGPVPADGLTVLTHNWRSVEGIVRLARAINKGDVGEAQAVFDDPALPHVSLVSPGGGEAVLRRVEALVAGPYAGLAGLGATEALDGMGALRVLGAHRAGAVGVNALNERLSMAIRGRLGVASEVDWYPGRPLMVTKNDHDLRLYNGDVGVVLPAQVDGLAVYFETAEARKSRAVAPVLLPEHDTVFATTVHKSQGSEYGHVVLVLPGVASPLLTRELLYTAVTRAAERVTVIGSGEVWAEGVGRSIVRMSRLAERCPSGAHFAAKPE